MAIPTVTIKELTDGINKYVDPAKKVLIGILNDFMDLQYAKSTPYTTGKTVLPNGTAVQDLDGAMQQGIDQKYKDIIKKIAETCKSGNLTPLSKNGENGITWDPKLSPILVVVRPDV